MSEYTSPRYRFKRLDTRQLEYSDTPEIVDDRIALDIKTRQLLTRWILENRASLVFSIPLKYNPTRRVWELTEQPTLTEALIKGYYYGASLPTETTAGEYKIALDERHRLYVRLGEDDVLRGPDARTLTDLYNKIVSVESIATELRDMFKPPFDGLLTDTPLAANSVYESDVFNVSGKVLRAVAVLAYADVDGTLKILQSGDGSNFDYESSYSLTGGSAVAAEVDIIAPYVKIRYENGGTDQTVFRLSVRWMV